MSTWPEGSLHFHDQIYNAGLAIAIAKGEAIESGFEWALFMIRKHRQIQRSTIMTNWCCRDGERFPKKFTDQLSNDFTINHNFILNGCLPIFRGWTPESCKFKKTFKLEYDIPKSIKRFCIKKEYNIGKLYSDDIKEKYRVQLTELTNNTAINFDTIWKLFNRNIVPQYHFNDSHANKWTFDYVDGMPYATVLSNKEDIHYLKFITDSIGMNKLTNIESDILHEINNNRKNSISS